MSPFIANDLTRADAEVSAEAPGVFLGDFCVNLSGRCG